MQSPIKIFHYKNGDVRVITETSVTVYTEDEWEHLSRYLRDTPLIDEGLKMHIPDYQNRRRS